MRINPFTHRRAEVGLRMWNEQAVRVVDLRPDERWAAACVRATVNAAVVQHDDGSGPAMYDLAILYGDGRRGAVEVTSATHPGETQFWKLATAGETWTNARLTGGWLVHAVTTANVRALHAKLPALLAELEVRGVQDGGTVKGDQLGEDWARLGVVSAHHSGTGSPGSIYLLPELPSEKRGGVVPDDTEGLANWLTTWVNHPSRSDNITKLSGAAADERHLFVFVPGFSTAPFDVQWILLDSDRPLPSIAPDVPEPLTDIWITGTMTAGLGYRWTRQQGWTHFDRCLTPPA